MKRLLHCLCGLLLAAQMDAAVGWNSVLRQPPDWYGTAEARDLADNGMLYQSPEGGWAKNRDMTLPPEANRNSKEAPGPTEVGRLPHRGRGRAIYAGARARWRGRCHGVVTALGTVCVAVVRGQVQDRPDCIFTSHASKKYNTHVFCFES